MRRGLFALIPFLLASGLTAQTPKASDHGKAFDQGRRLLAEALKADREDAELGAAAKRTLAVLPASSLARKRLGEAMKSEEGGLRRAMQSVHDDIAFRPLREAEMPPGFPEPTRVNEIEVKEYPAYRMARAPMKGSGISGGNSAFWVLFRHIKKNEIAMTAPVQTDMNSMDNGKKPTTMAFLYGSEDLGKLGKDGVVDVVDIEPMTVVSMGLRGRMNRSRFLAAQKQLKQWLKDNKGEWIAAGPIRTMGHNSPMVPSRKQYSEVQIPIEPKPRGTLH